MRKNLFLTALSGLCLIGCETSPTAVVAVPVVPVADSILVPVMPEAENVSMVEYPDGYSETIGDWGSVSASNDVPPGAGPLAGDRYEYFDLQRKWPLQSPGDSGHVRILRLGAFCDSSLVRRGYAEARILPTDPILERRVTSHLFTWDGTYFEADSGVIDIWTVGTDSVEVDYALRYRTVYDTGVVRYIRSNGTYLVHSTADTY